MKQNIVLVGFMGSGKSHIGRKLASRLHWQFVDTDRRLERLVGMTIADYYETVGTDVFREKEYNILQQVSRYHEAVISFGGNFPLSKKNLRLLQNHGYIVALYAQPTRIVERVSRRVGKRPTVDYEHLDEFVEKMGKQWEHVYPHCDFAIDTTHGGANQIVDKIVAHLAESHVEFVSRETH